MTKKTPTNLRLKYEKRAPRTPSPTPAQLECLKAWARLHERLRRSPTKRELSAELGLTESGAQGHLYQLTVKGLLEEVTEPVVVGRKLTDLGRAWLKMPG